MTRQARQRPPTTTGATTGTARAAGQQVELMLSAGRGPQECAWAVAELLDRLHADATAHGVHMERLDAVPGERRGTWRSVLLRLTGPDADAFVATWTGTLCWQAPSPYRPANARKNWYVTARPCAPGPTPTPFDEDDVDIVACRTGGPGGQHRDKASTAARATHRPTGLVVVGDTERHFDTNRRLALQRLRDRLAHHDTATEDAARATRRTHHDRLVRGNPVRIETPLPSRPPTASGR